MLSREVIDIVVASLVTFVLLMIIQSETDTTIEGIRVLILVSVLLINFVHLIISQLNRISDQMSRYIGIVNLFLLIISIILTLFSDLPPVEGFWDFVGYKPFMLIILVITLLVNLLVFYAEFLYIRRD